VSKYDDHPSVRAHLLVAKEIEDLLADTRRMHPSSLVSIDGTPLGRPLFPGTFERLITGR